MCINNIKTSNECTFLVLLPTPFVTLNNAFTFSVLYGEKNVKQLLHSPAIPTKLLLIVYNKPFNLSDITTWWAHYVVQELFHAQIYNTTVYTYYIVTKYSLLSRIKDTLCILDNATLKKNNNRRGNVEHLSFIYYIFSCSSSYPCWY